MDQSLILTVIGTSILTCIAFLCLLVLVIILLAKKAANDYEKEMAYESEQWPGENVEEVIDLKQKKWKAKKNKKKSKK